MASYNYADEFEGEDEECVSEAHDRIRRNYLTESTATCPRSPETIRVQLDEGLFAQERRAALGVLANARQRFSNLQLFNPAKNQSMKEKSERWEEKEKYTLDSLNGTNGALDSEFQWTRPEDDREVWSSKLQYLLAITSYSIGLGNVIRFPILVQRNGGLAFIIPFVVMLLVEGIPLFYLELAVGQRMRKAAVSCWNLVSPLAAGVGLASAAVSFLVGLYYNTLVAWTLLYLWGALTERSLPFAVCPRAANVSRPDECQLAGPFANFWYRDTLAASSSADEWAPLNLPVLVALLAAWTLSYFCLSRGLSSARRLVFVASTFPYVILLILFVKTLSLDGAREGVQFFFAPEWHKLAEPQVWLQAAAQVFFSLGLGFGGLIALSSYNPVNNNCYHDAIRVSLVNFFTSIFAGVVLFSLLGYKAQIGLRECQMQREKAISFYLADYNLKVIDYGATFTSAPPTNSGAEQTDYYDASEALASIKSLDRQLDSAAGGNFDYGDSDTEFIIDASNLIRESDLNKAAESIPNLIQCSLSRELESATQGPGLVFVVLAEAISHFAEARAWAIVFFLMLLTLGLDSQLGNLEGLLSSLADLAPASAQRRRKLTGFICVLSLLFSVVLFAHGGGIYMFAIFDEYAGSFSLILVALFELLAISYIYGLERFCDDCELMTGKRPPFIMLLSWRYLSPILLLTVILATARDFSLALTYQVWLDGHAETRLWPAWCIALGAALILACVIWIPAVAVLRAFKVNIVPEESLNQCWFPAEELREFHNIQEEHKVTPLERLLFGFRSDDY